MTSLRTIFFLATLLSCRYPKVSTGELDPCTQPKSFIDCGKNAPQFYYDSTERACLPGCGQNEMSFFKDLGDCENDCMKKRQSRRISGDAELKMLSDLEWSSPGGSLYSNFRRRYPLAFCELQRDTGVLCPGFIYNGCGGNANRFSTVWECTQSCVRKSVKHF